MVEKVYGGDGKTYTIEVKPVGHVYATKSEVHVDGKKIWESILYPHLARETAFRAAASYIKESTGSVRYVEIS